MRIVFLIFLCSYDRLPAVIDDLSCSYNTYLTIFQCSYSTTVTITNWCTDDYDVSVSCCKFVTW